jgi:hypothetical protein
MCSARSWAQFFFRVDRRRLDNIVQQTLIAATGGVGVCERVAPPPAEERRARRHLVVRCAPASVDAVGATCFPGGDLVLRTMCGDAETRFRCPRTIFGDAGTRIGCLRTTFGDAKTRIGGLRTIFGDAKTRIGCLRTIFGDAETRIGYPRTIFGDAETRIVVSKNEIWVRVALGGVSAPTPRVRDGLVRLTFANDMKPTAAPTNRAVPRSSPRIVASRAT